MSKVLCTAVLMWSAVALRADTFSFSYSGINAGKTISGSGDIIATADGSGWYTITGLSNAKQNGATMSLYAPGVNFFYDGSSSFGTFDFLLSGNVNILAFWNGNDYSVTGSPSSSGTNFQISSVPESATLSLLLTTALGVWVLARKLPSKTQL